MNPRASRATHTARDTTIESLGGPVGIGCRRLRRERFLERWQRAGLVAPAFHQLDFKGRAEQVSQAVEQRLLLGIEREAQIVGRLDFFGRELARLISICRRVIRAHAQAAGAHRAQQGDSQACVSDLQHSASRGDGYGDAYQGKAGRLDHQQVCEFAVADWVASCLFIADQGTLPCSLK